MRAKLLGSLLLLTITCTVQAQWGDLVAEFTFKGFSTDFKYAAYEMKENIYHPAREITRTSIFVINVDKNSYAVRPFEYEVDSVDQPGFKEAYAAFYKAVVGTRFGVTGEVAGEVIKFGPASGTETESKRVFYVKNEKYEQVIKNIPVPQAENEVMVKLDIVHNGNIKTLQAPERAPSSWGPTVIYKPSLGYLVGNKVAFFVEYTSSIVELPSRTRYMIVTGGLN